MAMFILLPGAAPARVIPPYLRPIATNRPLFGAACHAPRVGGGFTRPPAAALLTRLGSTALLLDQSTCTSSTLRLFASDRLLIDEVDTEQLHQRVPADAIEHRRKQRKALSAVLMTRVLLTVTPQIDPLFEVVHLGQVRLPVMIDAAQVKRLRQVIVGRPRKLRTSLLVLAGDR